MLSTCHIPTYLHWLVNASHPPQLGSSNISLWSSFLHVCWWCLWTALSVTSVVGRVTALQIESSCKPENLSIYSLPCQKAGAEAIKCWVLRWRGCPGLPSGLNAITWALWEKEKGKRVSGMMKAVRMRHWSRGRDHTQSQWLQAASRN